MADDRYRTIRVKSEIWERLKQQASENGTTLAGWLTHLSLQTGISANLAPISEDCRQFSANSHTASPPAADLQAILDDFDSSDDWD